MAGRMRDRLDALKLVLGSIAGIAAGSALAAFMIDVAPFWVQVVVFVGTVVAAVEIVRVIVRGD